MFVKKFKKKCDVRGCKNTANVFVISKRREMGNTIAMCRDCMKEALESTANYVEPEKLKKADRPLFPHPELAVNISSVADKEPEPKEVIEESTEEEPIPTAEDNVIKEEKEIPNPGITATPKPKTTAKSKNKGKKK